MSELRGLERVRTYSAEDVEEWCDTYDDPNPLHADAEDAEDGPFGEPVVPGLMLLNELSGMLTRMDPESTIILAGVTAARFRDPVLLDEHVKFKVKVADEGPKFTHVDFEIRATDRGSLTAHGSFSIVVQ